VWPRGPGGQCPQDKAHLRQSKRKTDEIDAENLARLARLDPKLLYPLKHRGEDSQAHMAITRSRQALISCRTQLVNHLTMHRVTEERGLIESDALIVKTYATSAPTKPLSLRIGDGSTVVEESRTR
jgi:hypothetical protein